MTDLVHPHFGNIAHCGRDSRNSHDFPAALQRHARNVHWFFYRPRHRDERSVTICPRQSYLSIALRLPIVSFVSRKFQIGNVA